jgi:hypothetical protein
MASQTLEGTNKYWSSGSGLQRTMLAFARPTSLSAVSSDAYGGYFTTNYGQFRAAGMSFGNGGIGRLYWSIDATGTDVLYADASTREDNPANWPWGLQVLMISGSSWRGVWLPYGPRAQNKPAVDSGWGSWSGDVGGETVSIGYRVRDTLAIGADVLCAAVVGYIPSDRELLVMRDTQLGCLFAPRRIIIPTATAAATAPTLSALSAINVTASSAQPRITYTF